MTIGTPQSLGHNEQEPSGGVTTTTLTAASDISSQDLVVVYVMNFVGRTPTSVSDGTNTYTQVKESLNGPANTGGTTYGAIYYAKNCAHVISPTITVNYGGSVDYWGIAALRCAGIDTTAPLDAAPTGTTGSSALPAISSGALAHTSEIVCAGFSMNGSTGAFTESAGFTSAGQFVNQAGLDYDFAYQVVSTSGSVTYGPTATNSHAWAAVMGTFFASTDTGSETMMLLGVGN